ncbi:MAG TPA: hypothetical protein VM370_07175 [Candidatus Thermoplasmatota archaeon]|nr:hypothetical protein [Candidatus Thermoplasmatota archaeon]
MAWLDEVVAFAKGTRPRPPPGPKRPLATLLLVGAALLHLPLVYWLVANVALQPPFAITVGLIAMGLAWSGGVSLEGRRAGTVRFIAAFGVAEGALAFVPVLAAALDGARWLFVAIALASLAAIVVTLPKRTGHD